MLFPSTSIHRDKPSGRHYATKQAAAMGFIGVYRALYDYSPQAAGELALEDGDLLYIIEKGHDDGWWKAKKKAGADDEEEPIGLVPHNYVEIVS